jgi:glutathione S-transferase
MRLFDHPVSSNPRGEVLALLIDGATVFESTIILEYLEERSHLGSQPTR